MSAPLRAAIAPRVTRTQRATFFSIQSLAGRAAFSITLFGLAELAATDGSPGALPWPEITRMLWAAAVIAAIGFVGLLAFRRTVDRDEGRRGRARGAGIGGGRMIPRLPPESAVSAATARYLRTLTARGFSGDVQIDEPSRLVGATDNSIYEIMPQAIVHPRVVSDLDHIVAALAAHRDVTLCARGGGTGTNGQSLHDGIIVETARHLTRTRDLVIDDDGTSGTITVEPGVVLDRLNAEVAAPIMPVAT